MLSATELNKSYSGRAVVSDVSLRLEPGRVLGLLGPNGAGKSTTVSMLCGLLRPDRGDVVFDDGASPMNGRTDEFKRRIGLVPQDIALYEELPARQNLELFGALYGLTGTDLARRVGEALELVGLADRARDKPSTFSGGMKRRLNIACALVHDPDVLVFDEPTVGVDPQSRNAIFDNLEVLRDRGKALMYTTHYMEEAERLCDRIVIVDHGRVVANDELGALLRHARAGERLEIDVGQTVDCTPLLALPGVLEATESNGLLTVKLQSLASDMAPVLAWCNANGLAIRHINSVRANLEDVFLALTGRQLRDHA
ncbi:ATP-binding cassette domain-containing protein [Casimicrobium huifangae]|uniref:ABC transporter ATP-binding protein n=1 Tax=Casimicrobium huifangae TaxID=2591109 RepID=UPI003784F995